MLHHLDSSAILRQTNLIKAAVAAVFEMLWWIEVATNAFYDWAQLFLWATKLNCLKISFIVFTTGCCW